jgi:hypothetical protein
VPVGRLEEVLDLLDMAGLRGIAEASVAPRDLPQTLAWLTEHCKVQADPETPHAWNVLHVDGEGHTSPVPGTTARPPAPTWKVLVDRTIKADAVAVARSEIEEFVRELRVQDAADGRGRSDGQARDTGRCRSAARRQRRGCHAPAADKMRTPLTRAPSMTAHPASILELTAGTASAESRPDATDVRHGKAELVDRALVAEPDGGGPSPGRPVDVASG